MAPTLGELLANLANLKPVSDKNYKFRKVITLGYQNIDIDDEMEENNLN